MTPDFDIDEEFFVRLDRISHGKLLDIDFIFDFLFDTQFAVKENKNKLPILELSDIDKYNLSVAAVAIIEKVFYLNYHLTKFLKDKKISNEAYNQLNDSYSETVIELLHSLILARFGLLKQAYQPLRRVIDSIFYGSFTSLTSIDLKENPFSFMLNLVVSSENAWNKISKGSINIDEKVWSKNKHKEIGKTNYEQFYRSYFFAKSNEQYCNLHHTHKNYKNEIRGSSSTTNNPLFYEYEDGKNFICYKLSSRISSDDEVKCTDNKTNSKQQCKYIYFVHITRPPSMSAVSMFLNYRLGTKKDSLDDFFRTWLKNDTNILTKLGVLLGKNNILKQLWSGLSLYVHANPLTHQHTLNFNTKDLAELAGTIEMICDITSILFLSSSIANPKINKLLNTFIKNIKTKNKSFVKKYAPNKYVTKLLSGMYPSI